MDNINFSFSCELSMKKVFQPPDQVSPCLLKIGWTVCNAYLTIKLLILSSVSGIQAKCL